MLEGLQAVKAWEVLMQTFLAFFSILVLTRILGKQQISQLTFYEYVNGITFGSIAATLATDISQRTWQHLLGLVIFAGLTFVMEWMALKSRGARRLLEGEPVIVIHNGKILERNMKKIRYNLDELTQQLRKQNVFAPEQVEFAILETDGQLTVLKKSQEQPPTRKDLGLPSAYEGVTTELILEGKIVESNLRQLGLTRQWLVDQLKARNLQIQDVVFASLDTRGNLYVDMRRDDLQQPTDITD